MNNVPDLESSLTAALKYLKRHSEGLDNTERFV